MSETTEVNDGSFDAVVAAIMAREEDAKLSSRGQDDSPEPTRSDLEDDDLEDAELSEGQVEEADENVGEPGADQVEAGEDKADGPRAYSDDDEITHIVDGQERKFKIGHLKALAGRESALTTKEREVYAERQKSEQLNSMIGASLDRHYKMATDAYQGWDRDSVQLALLNETDPQRREFILQEAKAREANVLYFHNELAQHQQRVAVEQGEAFRKEAEAGWAALTHPETGVKGWNMQRYDELRGFLVTEKVPASIVDHITDPAVWRLVDDYQRLKSAGMTVMTETKPVAKAPLKVIKSESEVTTKSSKSSDYDRAVKAAKASDGDLDSITALIMAREARN